MIILDGLGVNPEFESAKRELEALRKEYASLLAEYDDLTGTVRRNLEAEYMLQIGRRENEIFALQIQVQQLKREIALYQAAKNRREAISEAEVREIIVKEFAEYKAKLDELQKKVREAEEHHFSPKLSAADCKAVKEAYRELVKLLHPDLNPELPEAAKQLWLRIVEAYKNNDFLELNILGDMVEALLKEGDVKVHTLDRMEEVREEQERISRKIADLRNRMEQLRREPPFVYEKLLTDVAAVQAKRRELDELRENFEKHIEELTRLRDGLRGGKDA
ncbi:MAG: hypothetical protein IJT50_12725 [Lentisphaeria bacterium]|nr:hypothetical protein [Lentisphaeria bacterium]